MNSRMERVEFQDEPVASYSTERKELKILINTLPARLRL